MQEELLGEASLPGEVAQEQAIRPARMADYIGQQAVCEQLQVFIQAARQRGEPLDHTLLYGPPGLGKTTLAHILATEMEASIVVSSGPVLEKAGDLAALLTRLGERDLLFIDEIHRLRSAVEEILYPAMEDFQLDLVVGEGPAAQSVQLKLAPFTLVGATTRTGLLSSPLRERFGVVQRLDFYSEQELATIVLRSASIYKVPVDRPGAREIARRARGCPRVANRLLRRVRDYAQVCGDGRIDARQADMALNALHVDGDGLGSLDRKLLTLLVEHFGGGPVGLNNLAVALGEEMGTIEDFIEPYLIQQGYLARMPRGRMAMPRAYAHLGLEAGQEPRQRQLDGDGGPGPVSRRGG